MKRISALTKPTLLFVIAAALLAGVAYSAPETISGYVLDSACAFTKSLSKPISKECAVSCAKAGSPLVILADDGIIYWPIAGTIPSNGQNPKLLPFAGERVTATGALYKRGGSIAIVIERIEAQNSSKK